MAIESKLEVTNLLTPFLKAIKAGADEAKNLLAIGLQDYLDSQTSKYYKTYTFLHRNEKVKFFDIYYPLQANYKLLNTTFENLQDVFEEYKYITLIGSAGSGKSTITKFIYLNAIKQSFKIPILIELRHLNKNKYNLEEFIQGKILTNNIKPNKAILERSLKNGEFLFLFDGYDEIYSGEKDLINRQLENFIDNFSKNYYFITTRPGGGIENFPRFYNFETMDLTEDDILKFIKKMLTNDERKNKLIETLKKEENSDYIEYLKNPLLLSMFILAFESHPEIPKRKSSFYRNVYDTLYSKHDGITKNSYPREKLTNLQREDFENILSLFSYASLLKGDYTFTEEKLHDYFQKIRVKFPEFDIEINNLITDLITNISILIRDGFEFQFPHRSMQEYFAALFISKLNDTQKQKAYVQLADYFEIFTFDAGDNFWNLCEELDRFGFDKYFIIIHLKNNLNNIDYTTDETLFKTFFTLWNPGLYIQDGNVLISRQHNVFNAAAEFKGVGTYRLIWRFIANNKALNSLVKKEIKRLEVQLEVKIDSIEDNSIFYELQPLLIENGIIEKIKLHLIEVEKRLRELEIENENTSRNIDDFLDF